MAVMDPRADGDPDGPAPPEPEPDWEEGKFQIAFISVGQGDCCLVTCPDGQHIMIDCGSKSFEEEGQGLRYAWATLRGTWGLGRPGTKQNRLSAVILTHPDQDHYNQVDYMIGHSPEANAIPVSEVYFSDVNTARTDYKDGPLGPYHAGKCGSTLIDVCGARTLYRVTLRAGTQALHTWSPATKKEFSHEDELIDGDRVRVVEGEFPESDDDDDGVESTDWEVSIIAGNVLRTATDNSDTDGRNAASLVTLVRFGTEKVLICGDATRSTQDYLYNTFKNTDAIKNLEMLHVPHHGSSVTSCTADFVKLLRPKRVVITVKSDEHTHHLPGTDVIDAYIPYATASDEAHASRSWQRVSHKEFQRLRRQWEKDGAIEYEASAKTGVRRYTRTDLEDGDGYEGPVILDGIDAPESAVKYVLYQRQIDRDIKQTGQNENQWCYLPS